MGKSKTKRKTKKKKQDSMLRTDVWKLKVTSGEKKLLLLTVAEYRKFLKILYKSKLYFIGCCCCGKMIRNDLYSTNSMNASVNVNEEIKAPSPTHKSFAMPKLVSMGRIISQKTDNVRDE